MLLLATIGAVFVAGFVIAVWLALGKKRPGLIVQEVLRPAKQPAP